MNMVSKHISSTQEQPECPSLESISGKLIIGELQYCLQLTKNTDLLSAGINIDTTFRELLSQNDFSGFSGVLKIKNVSYLILANTPAEKKLNSEVLSLLTDRELQISNFVANGYSNKEVAKQLGISEWTIATHLRRIYSKLDVNNRTAMAHKCFG